MLHRDCETLRRRRSYPHGGLLVHTHYLPDSPFSGMRFWTSTVVLFFSNVYRGLNRSGPPAPTPPPTAVRAFASRKLCFPGYASPCSCRAVDRRVPTSDHASAHRH